MANSFGSQLPFAYRSPKPRARGLNYVRAPSILGQYLRDTVDCYGDHIDILKLSGHQVGLGSETAVRSAIDYCRDHGIEVAVGNPPIDVALSGGRGAFESAIRLLADWSVDVVEISTIARALDDEDLELAIALCRDTGLEVMVEVGVDFAHTRSDDHELFLGRRARMAAHAIAAGARFVLIESEGLTENRGDKPPRWQAVEAILGDIDLSRVVFEADHQDVMSRYIEIYGPKVNMMVDHARIEKVEAARRGFGPSQFLWGKVASIEADT